MKPLAIDLCAGLGGWTDGLLAEGWDCIGFDVERHEYGSHEYPAQLVLQDILTIDGRQFRGHASLIVASPPCQEFSYMAMPWTRAKRMAAALRGEGEFPDGYQGSRIVGELTALFDACLRIGREAGCPIVIENVRGAQPWVGASRWHFGSFHLWGDVPALMPITFKRSVMKAGIAHRSDGSTNFHGNKREKTDGRTEDLRGLCGEGAVSTSMLRREGVRLSGVPRGGSLVPYLSGRDAELEISGCGLKVPSEEGRRSDVGKGARFTSRDCGDESIKNSGGSWFSVAHNTTSGAGQNPVNSSSSARKAASARIAKIPEALARHIARVYFPAP